MYLTIAVNKEGKAGLLLCGICLKGPSCKAPPETQGQVGLPPWQVILCLLDTIVQLMV